MTLRYPGFLPMRQNDEALIVGACFNGAYQGLAANWWWGGGTGVGSGLMVPVDNSDTNATLVGFRWNERKDGSHYWYMQNTGDEALNQQTVDEWIDMFAFAGVKVLNILYYFRLVDIPSRNGVPVSTFIYPWIDYYMASKNKHKVKFALGIISLYSSFDANSPTFIPVTVGTWLNLPNMAAYWASLTRDPQYARDSVSGGPLIYTFNATNSWDATHLATVTSAVVAAGSLTPTYVNLNLQSANVNQITTYGPSGAALSGTQNSYKAQWQKDVAVDQSPGSFPRHQGITFFNDGRPVRGAGTYYPDIAVYSELENHINRRLQYARSIRGGVNPLNALYMYALLELAEGGAAVPAIQSVLRGVNTPSRGPILDALYNVTNGKFPRRWTDYHHTCDLYSGNFAPNAIVRTGAGWSTTNNINNGGGTNPAPYQFKEQRNSTAGDTWTLTRTNCTAFRLRGRKGPAYGTFNVTVNGGLPTLVTQTAVSDSYNQLLFDSGPLPLGTNVISYTPVAGLTATDECEADIERTIPFGSQLF